MSEPFTTAERTTAGMAEAQLALIGRRHRRRMASVHWSARGCTASVFGWAFSEPSAVGLWPLVLTLAAAGVTAAIGSRRLLDAPLGREIRAWIATGLLGLAMFVAWVEDWAVAGRVLLAESCLQATPDAGVFNCAGWSGWRTSDEEYSIRGQASRLVHHRGGPPPIVPNGVSFSTTEVQSLWDDWYLVTDLSFVDADYWF